MCKLVVRGIKGNIAEICNCEEGGFTGHCRIEYLLTWRVGGLEIISSSGVKERDLYDVICEIEKGIIPNPFPSL